MLLGRLTGAARGVVGWAGDLLAPGPSGRRTWPVGPRRVCWSVPAQAGAPGRTGVRVRGVHRSGAGGVGEAVEQRLALLPGVVRAELNAPLGCVVAVHGHGVDAGDLVAAVEQVEREYGLDGAPFCPGEHPGDGEAVTREAVLLAGDVLGAGVAAAGAAMRTARLPTVVPTALALAELTPRVSAAVLHRIGPRPAGLVFAAGGMLGHTLARQPAGLVLDAAHRFTLLGAMAARRRVWLSREAELDTGEGAYRAAPLPNHPRAAPLRDGAVERVLAKAAPLALTASGATAAGGAARAAAVLASGVPRAAVLGRQAFVAQVVRAASDRGVITFGTEAVYRLDRVDTVVLDASVLLTGRQVIDEVIALPRAAADPAVAEQVYQRAQDLIDVERLDVRPGSDGWAAEAVDGPRPWPPPVAEAAGEHRARGAHLFALTHRGELAALVAVAPELDPLAEALVAAGRRAGEAVLAGGPDLLERRVGVERVVPGGSRLDSSVRALQGDGRTVALVSARDGSALRHADVGIGVFGRTRRPPWGAHLFCGPGLGGACLLLDAIPPARATSRRGSRLAVAGSVAAAAFAMAGPAAGAGSRARLVVAVAAALAFVEGTMAGLAVGRHRLPLPVDHTPWHALPVQTVLDRLGSSSAGLTEQEAARRRSTEDNPSRPGPPTLLAASVDELANPITAALATGAGLSAAVGSAVDAALIGTVLAANALISATQRVGANRALRDLVEPHAATVRVRRGGADERSVADDLAVGDVVSLTAGDCVPADCRVLVADGLEVDESSLTGEAHLVTKTARPSPANTVADRRSMLYAGTAVAAGRCEAVVVATGERTEIGRTARLVSDEHRGNGVAARIRALTRATLPVSLGASTLLLASDLLRGRTMGQALGTAVSLAVAAVPEGLPFVTTVAELAAVRRMSRHGTVVRSPGALEALGRVDVLCFDKTGTLTEGRLRLGRISDGRTEQRADAAGPPLRDVLAAALRACPPPEEHVRPPHPTDRAVLRAAREFGVAPADGLGAWERLGELPFEPSRGYHAVLGRAPRGPRLCVKGAPEVVLARCSTWHHDGSVQPLDDRAREQVAHHVEHLARRGYRVLAVAERPAPAGTPGIGTGGPAEADVGELCLLGLLGLADAVRPTAAEAVRRLRQAGIEIIMITGDHPSTAEAIAAEVDALGGRRVVTGPQVDAMDDEQLAAHLAGVGVFARVSPVQKARIVEALRRAGRTVAVTGDGANDAPAIRLADVGLAVGTRATAAAREAADLVITDDRIETITDAIAEGRAMWISIRDALAVLVGGNLGEVAFSLGTGLLTGYSPLNARQLLLVNLLTDMLPAMAIAVRPPSGAARDVLLAGGPGAALGPLLDRAIGVRATATTAAATLGWLLARVTGTRRHAGNVALVALITAQLGQTVVLGGRSPLVLAAAAVSLGALVVAVQVPGLSRLFGCRPLAPHGWAIALGAAAAGTAVATLLSLLLARPAGPGTRRAGPVRREVSAGPASPERPR